MNEHLHNNNVPPKSESNGIYFIIPAAGNSLRYGNKNKILKRLIMSRKLMFLSLLYIWQCARIVKKVIVGF